ncbi:MAG TPA: hypothetical protein VFQ45_01110 [Longimicrobium sp.]|nr:hypothetical protein [Longimicrobium sp.]
MRRTYALPLLLLAVALSVAPACTPAAGGSTTSQPSRGRSDRLTREEISSISAANLYEVIQRLRPRWLTVRDANSIGTGIASAEIVVYQGQSLLGGPETLRQLTPGAAYSLEFMDGERAAAILPGIGSRRIQAAIIIHTSPQG